RTAPARHSRAQNDRRIDNYGIKAFFPPPHYFKFCEILRFAIVCIKRTNGPFLIFVSFKNVFLPSDGANGTDVNQALHTMANTPVYNITRANNVDFIQFFFVAWAERNQRGAMDYPVRVLKGIKCGLHIEDIDILPCYMFCNVLEE